MLGKADDAEGWVLGGFGIDHAIPASRVGRADFVQAALVAVVDAGDDVGLVVHDPVACGVRPLAPGDANAAPGLETDLHQIHRWIRAGLFHEGGHVDVLAAGINANDPAEP